VSKLDDHEKRSDGALPKNNSQRVTAYTIAIARIMAMPKDEIKVIARGAYLHDIGKRAIPAEILLKPDKLTDAEMAICASTATKATNLSPPVRFCACLLKSFTRTMSGMTGQGILGDCKATKYRLGQGSWR
jgi:hypothetical protein